MVKEILQWQIFFAVFNKPRYQLEIGNLIYRKKEKSYPQLSGKKKKDSAIIKCIEKGLIKEVKIPTPRGENIKEYHFKRRHYYLANHDILVDIIELKMGNIKLSVEEKTLLKILMSHGLFKDFVDMLLFESNEHGETIYKKRGADPDMILQTFAIVCSHVSIMKKISGDESRIINCAQFKRRLDEYHGRITLHNKSKCFKKIGAIEAKYSSQIFNEFCGILSKNNNDLSKLLSKQNSLSQGLLYVNFLSCLKLLGIPLLDKLSGISIFDYVIKTMYIELASIFVLNTYAYFNIEYPNNIEKKNNPPIFLQPLIDVLGKYKQEIESVTHRQTG